MSALVVFASLLLVSSDRTKLVRRGIAAEKESRSLFLEAGDASESLRCEEELRMLKKGIQESCEEDRKEFQLPQLQLNPDNTHNINKYYHTNWITRESFPRPKHADPWLFLQPAESQLLPALAIAGASALTVFMFGLAAKRFSGSGWRLKFCISIIHVALQSPGRANGDSPLPAVCGEERRLLLAIARSRRGWIVAAGATQIHACKDADCKRCHRSCWSLSRLASLRFERCCACARRRLPSHRPEPPFAPRCRQTQGTEGSVPWSPETGLLGFSACGASCGAPVSKHSPWSLRRWIPAIIASLLLNLEAGFPGCLRDPGLPGEILDDIVLLGQAHLGLFRCSREPRMTDIACHFIQDLGLGCRMLLTVVLPETS
eukprot:s641_g14.t1